MRASPWRILIGPLYHPQILGDYLQDPQIIPFALNQIDLKHLPSGYDMVSDQLKSGFHKALNYIPFETQLSDLLAQINPEDQPDILIWWGLYAPLPLDLPTSPIPTALIVSDWHENLTVVKRYAAAFDYIFCDKVLVDILKQENNTNCSYWPAYALYPERSYRIEPAPERIWDVSYIGSLNFTLHPKREKYLQRLLQLTGRYRILIDTHCYGTAFNLLLNQSKLVFNHSIRSEINLRVFEAAACGAAVLLEEDNAEIQDYLPSGVILYNEANFEAQIEYYLTHENERLKLTHNAGQKIQQETATHQFEKLLSMLPEVFERFGTARGLTHMPILKQHTLALRHGYSLFLVKNNSEQALRPLMTNSIPTEQWPLESLNLMAACLSDYEFNPNRQHVSALRLKAEDIFRILLSKYPPHPVIYTNAAWYCFLRHDDSRALPYSQFARQLLSAQAFEPESLRQMIDGILPFGHNYFFLHWQRLSAQIEQGLATTQALANLLHWNNLLLQAQVLTRLEQISAAEQCYQEALNLFPDFRLPGLELATLQARHAPETAFKTIENCLRQHFFNLEGHQRYLDLLLEHNQPQRALRWLHEFETLFAVVPAFRSQKTRFEQIRRLAEYLTHPDAQKSDQFF